MGRVDFETDRMINSTDNNGYADGDRDETLWEEDLVDTEIPVSDLIPEAVNENGEKKRPVYDEEGYKHEPGR